MTSSDKIGIIVAVGITVLFVTIAAVNPLFKSEIIHDATLIDKEITQEIGSIKQEISDDANLLEKTISETEQEIIDFEKSKKTVQEEITKKYNQKQVQNTSNEIQISIPQGTSAPGYEETDECYDPSTVDINLDDVVI